MADTATDVEPVYDISHFYDNPKQPGSFSGIRKIYQELKEQLRTPET